MDPAQTALIRVHMVYLHEKNSSLKCTCIYAADVKSRLHFQDKYSDGIRVKK